MLHSVSAFQEANKDTEHHPISDIVPIVHRKVDIEMEGKYPDLGIRSLGNGTFHKPILNGIDADFKKLYRIQPRDLLFNNIFAWEGAIAVVQPQDFKARRLPLFHCMCTKDRHGCL